MKSEKLFLKNRRGQNIVGILTKPESEIIGTAVLQHGYGGVKEHKQILTMQDAFLENGFQVFNFDSPNSFGESDGEYKDARLGLHADDFEDVANWVYEETWFIGKLLVSGHSMGGFAAARYALSFPGMVDFVIPLAPVISGELSFESWREFQPEILTKWKKEGVLVSESQSIPGMMKIKPYEQMIERLDHDLLKSVNFLNCPILLIACEYDISIPPKHIQIFFEKINFKNKEMHIIQGSGHTPRTESDLKKLYEIISDWLKIQLKK